jgi:hypothetical protein
LQRNRDILPAVTARLTGSLLPSRRPADRAVYYKMVGWRGFTALLTVPLLPSRQPVGRAVRILTVGWRDSLSLPSSLSLSLPPSLPLPLSLSLSLSPSLSLLFLSLSPPPHSPPPLPLSLPSSLPPPPPLSLPLSLCTDRRTVERGSPPVLRGHPCRHSLANRPAPPKHSHPNTASQAARLPLHSAPQTAVRRFAAGRRPPRPLYVSSPRRPAKPQPFTRAAPERLQRPWRRGAVGARREGGGGSMWRRLCEAKREGSSSNGRACSAASARLDSRASERSHAAHTVRDTLIANSVRDSLIANTGRDTLIANHLRGAVGAAALPRRIGWIDVDDLRDMEELSCGTESQGP